MIGQVVNETYRVERLLGEGGMGAVYEATHLRLGRRLALKILHARLAERDESRARFRREAEISSKLAHPNIVDVIDYDVTRDGRPYLVMELLEGESLAARVRTRGQLEVDEAAAIAAQLCAGVDAAHARGVIHRDLKPSNVVLCPPPHGGPAGAEQVKVLDFGVAKVLGTLSDLTRTDAAVGTPQYMAPEQAGAHGGAVDGRADVYAVGAILYRMLCGRPPVAGKTLPELFGNVLYATPPAPSTLRPELTAAVAQVIERALHKDPGARFASAGELAAALAQAIDAPETFAAAAAAAQPAPVTPAPPAARGPREREAATLDFAQPRPATEREGATRDDATAAAPAVTPEAAPGAPAARAGPSKRRVAVAAAVAALAIVSAALVVGLWPATNRSTDGSSARRPGRARRTAAATTATQARSTSLGDDDATHGAAGGEDAASRAAAGDLAAGSAAASSASNAPSAGSASAGDRASSAGGVGASSAGGVGARARSRAVRRAQAARRPRVRRRVVVQLMTVENGRHTWANLFVDGRAVGRSPLTVRLRPGRHRIAATRAGFARTERRIVVRPGKRRSVVLSLRR